MDHGVGHGQVQADAAGLEADQEHGHAAGLEIVDELGAIARLAGQGLVADAFGGQRLLDEFEHFGELREHEYVAAFGDEFAQSMPK